MSEHHAHALPEAPTPLELPPVLRLIALVAAVAGAGAFLWALTSGEKALAWSSYLIGVTFVLLLGVFGVLWVSILYLSGGVWSVTMRRIPEAMTAWLIPGGILAVLVGLGGHELYHWTHAEVVAADPILSAKEPFLNMTMFWTLMSACLGVWVVFAFLIVGNSRKQDETGKVDHTKANMALSALFVVVFALSVSIVSYYLLMSLDAHWFSTMYAVLIFTDTVQTGTAFVAIIAGLAILKGGMGGFVNENHLHSLAKMMFAATGFWAYIYFCQFMLIWYGNVPEETFYFINRWENGWVAYFVALPAIKFVIPFVYMVPRECKRKPRRVIAMAVLLLGAQFWELFLLVSPSVSHGHEPAHGHVPFIEAVVCAGFLGLFYLVFELALRKSKPVPLKDPRIRECLEYHQ